MARRVGASRGESTFLPLSLRQINAPTIRRMASFMYLAAFPKKDLARAAKMQPLPPLPPLCLKWERRCSSRRRCAQNGNGVIHLFGRPSLPPFRHRHLDAHLRRLSWRTTQQGHISWPPARRRSAAEPRAPRVLRATHDSSFCPAGPWPVDLGIFGGPREGHETFVDDE